MLEAVVVSPEGRRRCECCRHLLPNAARIDARFCGDRCRAAARRRLARQVAAELAMVEYQDRLRHDPEVLCPGCGRPVGPFRLGAPAQPDAQYRRDRRYCSDACRTRAWRARHRSTEPYGKPSR